MRHPRVSLLPRWRSDGPTRIPLHRHCTATARPPFPPSSYTCAVSVDATTQGRSPIVLDWQQVLRRWGVTVQMQACVRLLLLVHRW